MPKLSDTMEEGGVAGWLKDIGEFVEDGEPLVEIETDKATMEYASPEEGYLLKILAEPGNGVALDAPICVLGESKDESYDLDALIAESGGGASSHDSGGASDEKTAATKTSDVPAPSVVTEPDVETGPVSVGSSASRVKASPLAKKLAKDSGLDLSAVSGSGPYGRIIKKDVESAVSNGAASVSVAAPLADQKRPLSMMRKTIAKRLLAGKNEAPHFYLTVSAEMSNMIDFRARLNKGLDKNPDLPKVSVNDLIIKAAACALRKHPTVNSSWQGDHILEFGAVNISMAVALPTGLVTPVIRNADMLGVREISTLAKAAGSKAKAGNITNADLEGGTFTISNLGMTDVEEFTAIINPPQAAILAVGKTTEVPAVKNGEITTEKRMKMTLSCDHRVIDGMVGAQFLSTLTQYLEHPEMMLA